MGDVDPAQSEVMDSPPPWKRQRRLSLGKRLLLGVGLSIGFALSIATLMDVFFLQSWMLQPMWWVAERIHNENTRPVHINMANGIFWGFLVAMTVRRRSS
jgi:hypothetical protein